MAYAFMPSIKSIKSIRFLAMESPFPPVIKSDIGITQGCVSRGYS